mgnify:FL=1
MSNETIANGQPHLSRDQLRLLSEVERQDYYTSRLPDDYSFPLFSGKQAVLSQRQSGYRTTAKAAREIVDNAIEAGAKNIRIIFDRPAAEEREKGERKNKVRAVAFIDDGPGMSERMARFALSWGGGTHYEDPNFISKFGFGLPNASVNQAKLVVVYTRRSPDAPWLRVHLDLDEVSEFGVLSVRPAVEDDLPDFVQEYLDRKKIDLPTGTVVVWERPDRLTYTLADTLREHLLDDFGVTYRNMLPRFEIDDKTKRTKTLNAGRIRIFVEDQPVEAVDPLFLTPGARLYIAPNEKEARKGGASCTYERAIPVKYYVDEETGAKRLAKLGEDDDPEQVAQDPTVRGVGEIHVRVARMPVGFVDGTRGAKAAKTDGYRRFEVRQSRRGMIFVRADREIETFDAFPRSAHDVSSGLGEWPHISTYAYHFGTEIRFDPELDDVFNLGNDKQTIRPIDDFWRVMSSEGVDLDFAIKAEEKYQVENRKREKQEKFDPTVTDPSKTAPAASAADAENRLIGGEKPLPEHRREEAGERLGAATNERAQVTGESIEKARKAIEAEAKRKRYAIGFFEAEGGVFYKPDLGNGLQRVALINKLHPFYQVFYTRLAIIQDQFARQAVDLLLLALADAELAAEDEELAAMYETQRESVWTPFLKVGLKKLEQLEPYESDEESVNDDG